MHRPASASLEQRDGATWLTVETAVGQHINHCLPEGQPIEIDGRTYAVKEARPRPGEPPRRFGWCGCKKAPSHRWKRSRVTRTFRGSRALRWSRAGAVNPELGYERYPAGPSKKVRAAVGCAVPSTEAVHHFPQAAVAGAGPTVGRARGRQRERSSAA